MIVFTQNEIAVALWSCNTLLDVYKVQRALMLYASLYSQFELDEFQRYCDVRIQQIKKQVGKKD